MGTGRAKETGGMANPKDVKDEGVEKASVSEKQAKLDVLTKDRPAKIKRLILNRAIDSDDMLPEVPSAQFWKNMTDEEKDSFIDAVEKTGKKWSAYEQYMKSHWPPQVKRQPKMRE